MNTTMNRKVGKVLLPAGSLIIGISYLTKFLPSGGIDIRDFMIGLGTTFVVYSLVVLRKVSPSN
ncbi:MAG: hypothetical protein R2813_01330 [Flavobacteriales bacterium]